MGKAFFPIELISLRTDTVVPFELYLKHGADSGFVLYRSRNLEFTESHRRQLVENSVRHVYVPSDETNAYWQYIEQQLPAIIHDESLPTSQKSRALYGVSTSLVQNLFDDPTSGVLVDRCKKVVSNVVSFVLTDPGAVQGLLEILAFDYSTYTHSVNVCAMGVGLARELGYWDESDLLRLGEGLLLHDVGKSRIPEAVLVKKGALDKDEWQLMREHPLMGIEIAENVPSIPSQAKIVIRHHHEKLDGTGYPDGLKGDEIHVYARLAAIIDIFDALTTRRCYKDALRSFPALQLMRDEMSDKLDAEIFRALVLMLKT